VALVEIVGGEGEELYAIGVIYQGEGKVGANANFIFMNGELQTKAQYGLE